MRYPATQGKRDANEAEIIAALEKVGAWTEQLPTGGGMPDLLVGYSGVNYLMEVKIKPKKGKVFASHCGLNPTQQEWHDAWYGQVAIVRTPEDALAVIGL